MAGFSFGAAAGGAADALTQMLAERRAAALDAQRAEEARLEREYRDRQLAQQLEIAKMEDKRERDRAEASAAGRRLANIGKTYMETGKAAVGGTLVGQQVPEAMQQTILGAQSVLNEEGEPAVLEPGLSIDPTLPFTTNMPSPTAEMPMAMRTPLTSPETIATLPEMPPSEGVRPIAGLQRIQGPIGQQVRRVPTAVEAEESKNLEQSSSYESRLASIDALPPEQQIPALLALNGSLVGQPTKVRQAVQPSIASRITNVRRDIQDRQREEQYRKTLSATTNRQDATSIMRLYDDYRSDKRIQGAETAETAKTITAVVDKGDATPFDRLSLMYAFIRIADNYQTGVRNEEIKMMSLPMSDVNRLRLRAEALVKGNTIIDDKTMREISEATKRLIEPIENLANRRRAEFVRAADAVGIGDAFKGIIGTRGGAVVNPSDRVNDFMKRRNKPESSNGR